MFSQRYRLDCYRKLSKSQDVDMFQLDRLSRAFAEYQAPAPLTQKSDFCRTCPKRPKGSGWGRCARLGSLLGSSLRNSFVDGHVSSKPPPGSGRSLPIQSRRFLVRLVFQTPSAPLQRGSIGLSQVEQPRRKRAVGMRLSVDSQPLLSQNRVFMSNLRHCEGDAVPPAGEFRLSSCRTAGAASLPRSG